MDSLLKVMKVGVGVGFAWVLLLLAAETLVRRRAARRRWTVGELEAAYRRYPKTRPTVELRTFRLGWADHPSWR